MHRPPFRRRASAAAPTGRRASYRRGSGVTLAAVAAALLALLFGAPTVFAIDDLAPLPSPELQARYDRLTEELRCVKCQNQNIADSNAGIARDLRIKVREMLVAGRSNAEIMDYMVARYGEFVLYRPRFKPSTWLLWLAPFLLLGAGGLVVLNTVRSRAQLYVPDEDEA